MNQPSGARSGSLSTLACSSTSAQLFPRCILITVQGAALPVLARRKAMDGDLESGPCGQIYEPKRMMPRYFLDGRNGLRILEEFGIGGHWKFIARHMLWNFVLGYICLIMSIVLWVCGRESPALVIPVVVIAVGTAAPVYEFLRFIL